MTVRADGFWCPRLSASRDINNGVEWCWGFGGRPADTPAAVGGPGRESSPRGGAARAAPSCPRRVAAACRCACLLRMSAMVAVAELALETMLTWRSLVCETSLRYRGGCEEKLSCNALWDRRRSASIVVETFSIPKAVRSPSFPGLRAGAGTGRSCGAASRCCSPVGGSQCGQLATCPGWVHGAAASARSLRDATNQCQRVRTRVDRCPDLVPTRSPRTADSNTTSRICEQMIAVNLAGEHPPQISSVPESGDPAGKGINTSPTRIVLPDMYRRTSADTS
mmetsp:Transcript_96893/g.221904  ORF Transcript_96893/g.221904 Transcript_96893/m.221904 type:complete len:280 (+) Transcript_96893:103-942(+)